METRTALLARSIDHTNLSAAATREDIKQLCKEAVKYEFAAICINPWHVYHAAQQLAGSEVKVATVIGFPLGTTTSATKVFEANEAAQNGADEIDVVINIAALKEGLLGYNRDELISIREAVPGISIKVILETALLSDAEKRTGALLVQEIGAQMVKTSTGFNAGATLEDIYLLRETVPELGIKASGGIRDASFAWQLLEAGASRLGTSSGIKIISEMLLLESKN